MSAVPDSCRDGSEDGFPVNWGSFDGSSKYYGGPKKVYSPEEEPSKVPQLESVSVLSLRRHERHRRSDRIEDHHIVMLALP